MTRRTWIGALVAVLAAVVVSALVATAGYGGSSQPATKSRSSAGTVNILSLWGGSEKDAFIKLTKAFTKKTGIKINYETERNYQPVIRTRVAAGNPPDIAIIPAPSFIVQLAQQGALKDTGKLGLAGAYTKARFDAGLTSLASYKGKVYGVPAKGNSKSVIWYRPQAFKTLKAKVPTTYTQLIALTKSIKAKGKIPWAVGAKDSWTLTDFFENVYVRSAGPTKYTSLFTGKTKFTDASVTKALGLMLQVLDKQYVAGGTDGALGTGFVDAIGRVFGKKSDAQLYAEGGFVGGIATQQVNTALKPGRDIKFFAFPTITKAYASPVIFGGDYAVAFKDNSDVKTFLKYMTSAAGAGVWVSTGAVTSPNKLVQAKSYPNLLVRAEAAQIKATKTVRYDGSDLLPGTLGGDWGSTLQNIFQSPSKMKDLLADFQKKADREFK